MSSELGGSQEDGTTKTMKHKLRLKKLLNGRDEEWDAIVAKKNGSLTLLDLPIDVLKMIVDEV